MLIKHSTLLQANVTRLQSLDVFRGLTITLMIIVNSPGNNTAYSWLEHSSWNGCTLADLVFPFFLFIVGVASVFNLSKARSQGLSTHTLLPKILKRTIFIFLIGLLLNAFPYHFDWTSIRIMGVLQRIAICYFFAAWLFLTTSATIQTLITVTILVGYWLLMILCSSPDDNATTNFAAHIDTLLLGPHHLYIKTSDPEGILSTLPALATTLIGSLTGMSLLTNTTQHAKFIAMITLGSLMLGLGWVWSLWFPMNKALWTSSYVVWTGGLALLLLACNYWLIDIKKWGKWSKFFELFGVNALAIYVFHVFFLKVQMMITLSRPHHVNQNLKSFITETLFGWASLPNASLLYALSYTFFWFSILAILYRKKS